MMSANFAEQSDGSWIVLATYTWASLGITGGNVGDRMNLSPDALRVTFMRYETVMYADPGKA